MKKITLFIAFIFSLASLSAQNIVFEDQKFKTLLLSSTSENGIAFDLLGNQVKIDTNDDGEIQQSEAQNIGKLYVLSDVIEDYSGIEFFVNIRSFDCSGSKVEELDLSKNIALEFLYCNDTSLYFLDLSGNIALRTLECSNSNLTDLDLSQNVNLFSLNCNNNDLSLLDVSKNKSLKYFKCDNNAIFGLDVSRNLALVSLLCNNNKLENLYINSNTNLTTLICDNNLLTDLFLKNGKRFTNLFFSGNPSLKYICTDAFNKTAVQDKATKYGYVQCEINDYCSLTPGGNYFELYSNALLDTNNNGCDYTDQSYPFLKYKISDGTNSQEFIANQTGDFIQGFDAGNYSITPMLENPTYFDVSPPNAIVSFTEIESITDANFCITPSGIHHDLEIYLLPMNDAISGEYLHYKIVYKNKGNQTQSGNLTLVFDQNVLVEVDTNPEFAGQEKNHLIWNFDNLIPFESREIDVYLQFKENTDLPAIESGHVLEYTVAINGAVDDNPMDNINKITQIVSDVIVPISISCMEGAAITQSQVGKDVHYLIRFENFTPYDANNIVVKNVIDLNRFDINSLKPICGSASFKTRISNGNQVEFIFENIDLSSEVTNNKGYFAYKIKTLDSLAVGNSFSNSASIYFGFDTPIETNVAQTNIVGALKTTDFEFSRHFSLYPNPANEVLNLRSITDVGFSSIQIYNMVGQMVLSVPKVNDSNSIDISSLKTGNYILKLISDNGNSHCKFVKN